MPLTLKRFFFTQRELTDTGSFSKSVCKCGSFKQNGVVGMTRLKVPHTSVQQKDVFLKAQGRKTTNNTKD